MLKEFVVVLMLRVHLDIPTHEMARMGWAAAALQKN